MPRTKNKLTDAQISQLVRDVHEFGLNVHSREIFINGYAADYDDDPGIDYRSAQVFLRNLHVLESLGWSKITIHMGIAGGDWPSGMAMYDAIQSAKSHIVILSYAQASSMSGVLLQAADERVLMPNTHFMAHFGSFGMDSTSQAVSSAVAFNDIENQKMLRIFAERCVEGSYFKSRRWGVARVSEYLSGQMKERGDWYLSSQEAVDYGFADRIFGS
jgi:ATP-dependent protease ClpP protease subunit